MNNIRIAFLALFYRYAIPAILSTLVLLGFGCSSYDDDDDDDSDAAGYEGSSANFDTSNGFDEESRLDFENESNEGDRYEDVGTNPYVVVAHDPFSTFAADVDTASYDIFRRDIQDGVLPENAGVRLEEFVNYFSYDYSIPDIGSEHPFTINVAAAPNILDNGTTVLRVGIQAARADKPRANLVFLMDTSGSMASSDKLALAQYMMIETLDVLDPADTVSIVTYAGSSGLALSPTAVSQKSMIIDAIKSFSAGGSTAGAAGIDLAYQQAEEVFIEDGINHVVLCTDGDFNVGPYSDDELVALIEKKRKTGITLTALGFGSGNLNDSMMEKVTNAGNGTYAMISTGQQAHNYVVDRMLGSLVYVAKDMKIQVEFNPDLVYAYRLLGYENRDIADEDFRVDTVDAGEVGSGHRVTALYELVMVGDQMLEIEGAPELIDGDPIEGVREVNTNDMVRVKVRYKDTTATESDPAREVAHTLGSDDRVETVQKADEDFQWAISVAAFAEILKDSPYADTSRLPIIKEIVTNQADKDADRAEFVELFIQAMKLLGT